MPDDFVSIASSLARMPDMGLSDVERQSDIKAVARALWRQAYTTGMVDMRAKMTDFLAESGVDVAKLKR